MTATAYRSHAPAVLAVVRANKEREAEAVALKDQLLAEWIDAGFAPLVRDDNLSRRVVGIRLRPGADDAVPEGRWRWAQSIEGWVPDRRYGAGKHMSTVLDLLGFERKWLPGMPVRVVTERWYTPGVMWAGGEDDAVWCFWRCTHDLVVAGRDRWGGDALDLSLWALGKLSEFHAASEAIEDEKAQRRITTS